MRICNRCQRGKPLGKFTKNKTICDDCTSVAPARESTANKWGFYKPTPKREPAQINAESVLPEVE